MAGEADARRGPRPGQVLEDALLGVPVSEVPRLVPGVALAVVTVVAPSERFGPREKRKNTEAVKSTAAEMTRYLSRPTSAAR